jgi:hypothetical protein
MVHILYHKKSNVSYLAHLCTYVPFPLRDASGGNIATKIHLPQQLAGRPFPLTGRQWQLPANCRYLSTGVPQGKRERCFSTTHWHLKRAFAY